jgi:hypothetical protein
MWRRDGEKEKGWGGYPFWWPVLIAPHDTAPVVYAALDPSEESD